MTETGLRVIKAIGFELVFAFSNFVERANIDLPEALLRGLSAVPIVPALHRRHPSREQRLLDSNFGTIVMLQMALTPTNAPAPSS